MTTQEKNQLTLMDFVKIDDDSPNAQVLRVPAIALQFPLSDQDMQDIESLQKKFLATENCAGLAAPQIGIHKQIIVYSVSEEIKQYRDDVDEMIPTRTLINPTYQPHAEQGRRIDWEACFSVAHDYGEVPRYIEIEYEGLTPEGHLIKGIARGFHARLLQHEIGHLNGQLFIDLFEEGCRHGDFETMRAIRMKELEQKNSSHK